MLRGLVLFQGDSVTDAGRSRIDDRDLGRGYAAMVAAWYQARHPEVGVRFINRGVSGDRVRDLRGRWRRDCLDLKPGLVSILIGINDTWRRYDSDSPTGPEEFEADYRHILQATREATGARLVLCEPFLLPVTRDQERWREDLDPKIEVVRRLAREFGALLLPLDGLLARAAVHRSKAFWAEDGIHPSPPGHALIAQAWLRAVMGESF